ncbi:type II toxin-antitoxin system PemK/MazF family toxin [Bacillus sp. NP157]|nr:type II toxin-antitoxin system PemK/MazF family toxin [Bacillus sp. NP157]
MSFHYAPLPGTVLICRFPPPGAVPSGEMAKTRPVIVVSRRLRGRPGLVNIVPISMTAPLREDRWHVRIPAEALPAGWRDRPGERWAKCDMATVVSLERLSQARVPTHRNGMQTPLSRISEETLREIRKALAYVFHISPVLEGVLAYPEATQ